MLTKLRFFGVTVARRVVFFLTYLVGCSLVVALQCLPVLAQQDSETAKTGPQHPPAERDGQHDFDFMLGNWLEGAMQITKSGE
jgi:hypothetical protein